MLISLKSFYVDSHLPAIYQIWFLLLPQKEIYINHGCRYLAPNLDLVNNKSIQEEKTKSKWEEVDYILIKDYWLVNLKAYIK